MWRLLVLYFERSSYITHTANKPFKTKAITPRKNEKKTRTKIGYPFYADISGIEYSFVVIV